MHAEDANKYQYPDKMQSLEAYYDLAELFFREMKDY